MHPNDIYIAIKYLCPYEETVSILTEIILIFFLNKETTSW